MKWQEIKEKTKKLKENAEKRGQQALEKARKEIERRRASRQQEKQREKEYQAIEKEAYHRGRLKAAKIKGFRRGQQHKTFSETILNYAKKNTKTPKIKRLKRKSHPKRKLTTKNRIKPIQWF